MAENQQILRLNIARPFRLDHKEIDLDKLDGWWSILMSSVSVDARYVKFMPGGTHSEWTSRDEDPTRGLLIAPVIPQGADQDAIQLARDTAQAATNRIRLELQELLALIGSYCPAGLFRPVTHESSSLDGILDTIKTTFNLHTHGEDLVAGYNMKFNKATETYQQFYMQLRSFHMESLLPEGTMFKGRRTTQQEAMSPLADSMIVQMWLSKIHPKLPNHIKSTKSYLFTEEKPTLVCNQKTLSTMMDTMLAEIEKNESDATANRVSMDSTTMDINRVATFQQRNQFPQTRPRGNFQSRGFRPTTPYRGNYGFGSSQTRTRSKFCKKCYETGKSEFAYSSHNSEDCNGTSFKTVRYVNIPVDEYVDLQHSMDQFGEDFGNLQLEDSQIQPLYEGAHLEEL